MVTPFDHIFTNISCLKTWFLFWHYLGCFGYFSKKLGDFFSKSSGHPGPRLIRLTDLDELFKASGDSKIVRAPDY
jgi:hypothetical protein